MKIKVFTAMFQGSGGVTCHVCNRKRRFSDGAKVISLDYGDRMKVISASDGTVVHVCGRQYTFYCARCDRNIEPAGTVILRKASGKDKLVAVCPCGNSMTEVEVE